MSLAHSIRRVLIGSRRLPWSATFASGRSVTSVSVGECFPTSQVLSRSVIEKVVRHYSVQQRGRVFRGITSQKARKCSIKFSQQDPRQSRLWLAMAATLASTSSSAKWCDWSWRPTSSQQLETAEQKMLSTLKTKFELFFVDLPSGEKVNTLKMGQGPPLVMIHGFGGGLALFAANLEHLAETHTVYAIDLPGFGRSTRPSFNGTTPTEAELYFVNAFDQWMDAVGLQTATIMGHSLGAYLSASWALSHPHRFTRLILVDPFGVPKKPEDSPKLGFWRGLIIGSIRAVSSSPLTLLRAAGPWGPGLIKRLRPDLIEKFEHLHQDPEIVSSYIYHVNAQKPATGEEAFTKIMTGLGYANNPLIDRLPELDASIPVSFIYGMDSWMKPLAGVQLKEAMPNHQVDFVVIPDAGHHVYIDQWQQFNNIASIALEGNLGAAARGQYQGLLGELKRLQDALALQEEQMASSNTTS